jgi:hypothetical protein
MRDVATFSTRTGLPLEIGRRRGIYKESRFSIIHQATDKISTLNTLQGDIMIVPKMRFSISFLLLGAVLAAPSTSSGLAVMVSLFTA